MTPGALVRSLIAAVLMVVGSPAMAQTAQAPAQRPEWRLGAGGGQCMLTGLLSPGDEHLYLQTIAGSDYYRLAISEKNARLLTTDSVSPFTLRFHDADAQFNRPATIDNLPNEGSKLIVFNGLDASVVQALTRASSVSVERRGKTFGPFAFRNADRAIEALDGCTARQLVAWGADPEQFKPGGTRPVALQSRDDWIPNDKLVRLIYFARGSERAVYAVMRVAVSEDGHVDGCARLEGPEDAAFERQACAALFSRPLFRPARNPAGVSVRGVATFEIVLMSRPR